MVTAKQRKARALFAKRAKSGYFRKKRKTRTKSRSRAAPSGGRRRSHMARRKTYRRRRSGGLGSTKNIAKKVLVGMGAASLLGGGLLGAAAGFFLGGLPGAVGGYAADNLKGMLGGVLGGTGTSPATGKVYS